MGEGLTAGVITVSDRCHAGEMEDRSGPAVAAMLRKAGFEAGQPEVVPDEREMIADAIRAAQERGCALIVTTGGTGLSPRDVTPQATISVVDYEVPGLAEQMRRAGLSSTPMSMISRATAGVRKDSLVLNLPGSERGARESLAAVTPALHHAVRLLRGEKAH
ncbi:MAG: MogA/MoaB family molybdenum cofactor biosynthesis protein [Candidatus Dormibacterales bacterium]